MIVGGGTAGTIAAIQAARAGAKTVLIEQGGLLGGTTTAGGINFPGLFHAWGRQVIGGIGWELVEKTVDLDGGTMPDFSERPKHHWHHQVRINGSLYALLAEEACLKAGVTLSYYQFPQTVETTSEGWRVNVVGKGAQHSINCKQLIDSTGGGDVVGMLGFDRLREETIQPGTLVFKLSGYDPDLLDEDEVQRRYLAALSDQTLKPGDFNNIDGAFIHFLRTGGENSQHVIGADSSTADTKTCANIEGRRSLLRLLRFVKSLSGCQNARIEMMMQETAVRETFRIVGESYITADDYVSGRLFDDAVCYSFYPIDLHNKKGITLKPLAEGIVPTIPRSAMIPKGSTNIMVAGRSVSSDRLANSALRVQASCMAMGQAAGVIAALAAEQNCSPMEVALDSVRATLAKHNAIVSL